MSEIADLAKGSVKGLGPAAALVTALPSAVFVLGVYAILSSRLYPWAAPLRRPDGSEVPEGINSIVATAAGLGVAGGILALVAVVVLSVILRPLQISLVQFLEGYSDRRGAGFREQLAVERHQRRRSYHLLRRDPTLINAPDSSFDAVACFARREAAVKRMKDRAHLVVSRYPVAPENVMPTLLGNVLRRAETTAGERYGLDTVVTYPRIYPYLSPRLDGELGNQLDIVDTACTFVVMLSGLALVSAPLVTRLDPWSAVPVALAGLAAISYRAARVAAKWHGDLLCTAYDLHRFDMRQAMHLELPKHADQEVRLNKKLTDFLSGYPADELKQGDWPYCHPPQPNAGDKPATGRAGVGLRQKRAMGQRRDRRG